MVEKFEKEEISLTRKILGFILTLLLVPLLFVGTCVPITLSSIMTKSSSFVIVVYTIVFCGFCVWGTFKIKNIGIRIALGIIIFILACFLSLMLPRG